MTESNRLGRELRPVCCAQEMQPLDRSFAATSRQTRHFEQQYRQDYARHITKSLGDCSSDARRFTSSGRAGPPYREMHFRTPGVNMSLGLRPNSALMNSLSTIGRLQCC